MVKVIVMGVALALGVLAVAVAAQTPALLTPGTYFSGTITDRTVLQRGAETQAGVYGTVVGAQAGTAVSITVNEEGVGAYSLRAEIISRNGTELSWHALLKPHAASGGNVTISASCASCANDTAATIRDLTYGDVWFCAGKTSDSLHAVHRHAHLVAVLEFCLLELTQRLLCDDRPIQHGVGNAVRFDSKPYFRCARRWPVPKHKDFQAPPWRSSWRCTLGRRRAMDHATA